MTISSISTSQQSLNMRIIISRQNEELSKLTQETASGIKQDVFAENAGAATKSLQMRSFMASTSAYKSSNELLEGKLDTTYEALSNLTGEARNFLNLSLAGGITSMNRDEYSQEAKDTLARMVTALNTTYSGEFLFSGLSTDQKAVEIDASGNSVNYLGDTTGTPSARIDDDVTLNYGIRADNPAFTAIFDALNTVLTTDLNALSDADFETMRENVTTSLNDGITGLTSLAAGLGNNQNILGAKINDQNSRLNIYNNAIAGIETADPEETALRLNQLLNQLEVSYQVTSRLNGMSLLNYL